jgi:L-rhamnonate dehydratase
MKITDIEAIHLRREDPNIGLFDGSYDDCVIRVPTDEGITGIGEVESLAPATQAVINAEPAHSHACGLASCCLAVIPCKPKSFGSSCIRQPITSDGGEL